MTACPKFVCFVTSVIIAWGISEIWPAIFAWFDHKINGTEIPYDQVIWHFLKIPHMFLILLQGILLHGVRKENSTLIGKWLELWTVGLLFLAAFGLYFVSIYPVITNITAKGQLISKCLLGVIVSTKKTTIFFGLLP
jgi:cytochrome bd-type quinol oxidase subunit 2